MKNSRVLDIAAKAVRIITVPPVMVTAFLMILWGAEREIFPSALNLVISIIGLGIFPVLSYVLWAVVPGLKKGGRSSQRKTAFIFSLAGYTGTFLFGHITGVPEGLMLIIDAYFISVLLLAVTNFIFKIKASGHACSATGPLALLVYFLGWAALAPCILVEILIFWASMRTGRHTMGQLLAGMSTALAAFLASVIIHSL